MRTRWWSVVQVSRIASRNLSALKSNAARHLVSSTASKIAKSSGTGATLVHGDTNERMRVAYWLAGTAGWSLSLIALGGITRLTGSGLSMTNWHWVGEKPPINESDWQMEFEAYKQSPEYRYHNKGITLNQFKFIFWMEYAHRFWGRAMGVFFLLPGAYFITRGRLSKRLLARLSGLFTAGASQAFVGWWMVRSGLEEPDRNSIVGARVSPYRLASHLAAGATIYSGLLWTALDVAFPRSSAQLQHASYQTINACKRARKLMVPLVSIIGVTALSGAFVAGLDAGRAFNTVPLMNGNLIPDEYWPGMQPWWRNMFESTATVQFHHRVLAVTTLAASSAAWIATSRMRHLPRATKLCLHGVFGTAWLQVTLGVSTLLTYVPVSLGSAHQVGAFSLFTIALCALHTTRLPSAPIVRAARLKLGKHSASMSSARNIASSHPADPTPSAPS